MVTLQFGSLKHTYGFFSIISFKNPTLVFSLLFFSQIEFMMGNTKLESLYYCPKSSTICGLFNIPFAPMDFSHLYHFVLMKKKSEEVMAIHTSL